MGVLRLLLALSVVATHCGAIFNINFVGGQIAVQAFYIISGFYMTLILNEKYIKANNSYKLFISNRLLRLYPIYWTVLILSCAAFVGFYFVSKSHHLPKFEYYFSVHKNLASFAYLIGSNIAILGQDIVMFMGISPADGTLFFTKNFAATNPPLHYFLIVPQAWTLAIEIAFYALAPFLVRRKPSFIITLIILSLALRVILYNVFDLKNDPWTYRFFPTEIVFFLLGYFSYRLNLKIKNSENKKAFIVFALMVVFTIIYQFIPDYKSSVIPFSFKEIGYLGLICISIPVLFNLTKKYKWDRWIGELSYPVYMSHMLVYFVAVALPVSMLKTGWAMAVLTILCSIVLNKVIADPIERFRQARLKK